MPLTRLQSECLGIWATLCDISKQVTADSRLVTTSRVSCSVGPGFKLWP